MQDTHENVKSSEQTNMNEISKGKALLKQAWEHFNKNENKQTLMIYNSVIQSEDPEITGQNKLQALRNRSALYFSQQKYPNSIQDCIHYLKLNSEPNCPEIYVVYISALIKISKIKEAVEISKISIGLYPYHKKLKELQKQTKQLSMTENQQTYVDNMFEKLCSHAKIREWLKDQSFLTKVERLIRNPSLSAALQKADPRIAEVADFMLMAEQDQ